jgi:hypothetical protein
MARYDMPFEEALGTFYTSQVYADLEQEHTKLWRFSPQLLTDLWCEERQTGSYDYPEAI